MRLQRICLTVRSKKQNTQESNILTRPKRMWFIWHLKTYFMKILISRLLGTKSHHARVGFSRLSSILTNRPKNRRFLTNRMGTRRFLANVMRNHRFLTDRTRNQRVLTNSTRYCRFLTNRMRNRKNSWCVSVFVCIFLSFSSSSFFFFFFNWQGPWCFFGSVLL